MIEPDDVEPGFVYLNGYSGKRLVVSVCRSGDGTVVWRTADLELGRGIKSQGKASIQFFSRWATARVKASPDDMAAFDLVLMRRRWRRRDRDDLRRMGLHSLRQ